MRLVLADDHVMFLDALREDLERRGHVVVGSCHEVESLVDTVVRGHPDLCVLDVNFDGHSVLDAAAAIRLSEPATSLVLLTGAAPPDAWVAFEVGIVDAMVNKLCSTTVLDRVIGRVAKGEKVVERFTRPAQRQLAAGLTCLTPRERSLARLLVQGASTAEMALALGISLQTARSVTRSVLRKLGVSSRNKAARLASDLAFESVIESGIEPLGMQARM